MPPITHAEWLAGVGYGSINTLNDVELTSPQDGDTLVYNGDTDQWENGEAAGGSEQDGTVTMRFVETAIAGIYTASVDVPTRAQLTWVGVLQEAEWAADTAMLEVDNGIWNASDLRDTGNYPVGRAANAELGGYSDWGLPYFPSGATITGTVTTTGAGGTTGRATVALYYVILPNPATDTAVKS